MSTTADRVVVELEARTAGFTNAIRGAGTTTDAAMSQIERSAGRAEAAIRQQTNSIVLSAAAQANAGRNLGRQIADVGTQLASGSSPFLIFAQQAPQFADAMAGSQGAAGRLASFFAGPWGAALLAAASVVGVLIGKLFEAEGAHQAVAKAADAAAEAEQALQDVLGGTIQSSERARIAALDLANSRRLGAIAAVNEARAQLTLAQAYAQTARSRAVGGRAANFGANVFAQQAEAKEGDQALALDQAQRELNAIEIRLKNLERVATSARNIEAKQASDSAGKSAGVAQRKEQAEARRAANEVKRAQLAAQRAAEEEARNRRQFANDLKRSQNELLAAEAELTTDTRLQDEALRLRIENERDRAKNDIDANPNYTGSERAQLKALEDRTALSKLNKVTLDAAERALREDLDFRSAEIDNQRDLLQSQAELADSAAERREIALRLVDLAFEQERAELEAVIASQEASEAAKKIAQARLAVLGQLEANARTSAQRQNEGPLARYRRDITGDINEELEQIEVNALRTLEDSLTRATVKALGLKGALGDIVGQLIQIGIQRAVIGPLADALFGGGSGGGGGGLLGGFLGGLVGGGRFQLNPFGRASGGYVGPGQTVRVNEGRGGVELLRMGSQGGEVISLGQTQAVRAPAQTIVQQTFVLDNRGGITTPQLLDQVNRMTNGKIAEASAGTYERVMRDVPGRVGNNRRWGT